MRNTFFILVIITASCGSDNPSLSNNDDPSTPYVGSWRDVVSGDTIELGSDGDYSYSGVTRCCSMGQFSAKGDSDHGSITINTITSNCGTQCMSIGTHLCAYDISDKTMRLVCDFGTLLLERR